MDEPSDFDPHLQAAILEVVDNQLRDNEPPETRQTYNRLLKLDYSPEEARRLIGAIVVVDMVRANKPFDHARFVKALKRLPRLPWED